MALVIQPPRSLSRVPLGGNYCIFQRDTSEESAWKSNANVVVKRSGVFGVGEEVKQSPKDTFKKSLSAIPEVNRNVGAKRLLKMC